MQENAAKAKQYQLRAIEIRNIARGLPDPKERQTLMDVADDYDDLASEMLARCDP